jgi:serine/threonine protein phosphatase PrpC
MAENPPAAPPGEGPTIPFARKHAGLPSEARRKAATETRNSAPFVYFAPPRRCWGRLQSRVLFALIDGHGQARTREIASVCWDDPPTPRQIYSQGRACKAIGAVRIRREGREWVWSLQKL